MVALAGGHALGQERHQFRAVLHALRVGGEARVRRQFRQADRAAVVAELAVVADGHDQVAVAGREHLVRHQVLVRVAGAPGRHARGHVVEVLVGQHGHLAVQQRHVDVLAHAAARAFVQRGQDAHGGIHAGHQVGHGDAGLLRTAARQVVAFAGDAHQAAHALDHEVVAGAAGVRAGLAEARDGAVDQAGVDFLQAVVVQAVLGQAAHLEVFHQDVALQRQFAHQFGAAGRRDVQRHGELVAVGRQVVGRLAGVVARLVLQVGRPPGPRVVARAGPFDLDHLGAEIGEVLGAPGAGQDAGQVEHTYAG